MTSPFPGSLFAAAAPRRRLPKLVLASALLAVLAGCNPREKLDPFTTSSVVADDYHVTHPITDQQTTITMMIPVSAYERNLTDGENGNVAFFAQNFLTSGAALVGIARPTGAGNQSSAARIAAEIQGELVKNGVPPGAIRKGSYAAGADDSVAPVKLAYLAMVATTDPCGQWPDLATESPQNRHFHNYACATQQNLAAEIANPLDLKYPRGMTPADTARRGVILQKYRQGERTSGDHSGETGGTVASGIGQ